MRHALLAVGLLLLVQGPNSTKGTVSPLAVLVAPTLVLAEGLGTGCGGLDGGGRSAWPEPVQG